MGRYMDGSPRPKTRNLLRAAERSPIMPHSPDAFGRFKRLEKLGYLRQRVDGWVRTSKPYNVEAPRDEMVFDFEAHRRRFRED
jgi:hypothetical protein